MKPGLSGLAVLERLLHAAVSQDRIGNLIEIEALRALALAASDDEPAAVAALAEAATLSGQWSIWIKEAYLDQEQPEVACLGQQPVQGGLIGDRACDDGFFPSLLTWRPSNQAAHRPSRMPLTRIS